MMRLAFLVAVLSISPLCAQDAPEEQARALLSEATALKKNGQAESAAMRLRRAIGVASAIEDSSRRRNILTRVQKGLAKLDPLYKKEQAARAAASRNLLREAEHEIKRGWNTLAHGILQAANRILPGSADTALQTLGASDDKKLGSLHDRYFGEAAHPIGESGWKVDARSIVTPPLDGKSVMIVSKPKLASDCMIRAEVRLGEEPGKMALVFGVTEELQYHLLELRNDLGFSEIRLYWWDGRQIHTLGTQLVTLTRKERSSWLPLQIEIDGRSLRGTIGDGIETVRAKTRVDTAGAFGIFVSDDSQNQDSVSARFVRVEEK